MLSVAGKGSEGLFPLIISESACSLRSYPSLLVPSDPFRVCLFPPILSESACSLRSYPSLLVPSDPIRVCLFPPILCESACSLDPMRVCLFHLILSESDRGFILGFYPIAFGKGSEGLFPAHTPLTGHGIFLSLAHLFFFFIIFFSLPPSNPLTGHGIGAVCGNSKGRACSVCVCARARARDRPTKKKGAVALGGRGQGPKQRGHALNRGGPKQRSVYGPTP